MFTRQSSLDLIYIEIMTLGGAERSVQDMHAYHESSLTPGVRAHQGLPSLPSSNVVMARKGIRVILVNISPPRRCQLFSKALVGQVAEERIPQAAIA